MKWLTHLPFGGLLLALTPIVLADGDPQQLTAADAPSGQGFGSSTDISGDVIVVGAPTDDDLGTDAGAVYVFERQAGVWLQVLKLTAPDGAASHRFGQDVALDDGLLAVTALGRVAGSVTGGVYVYSRVGSSWVYDTVIVGSPPSVVFSQVEFALDVEVGGGKIAVRGRYRGEYGDRKGYSHVFSHQGMWGSEFTSDGYGRKQMGFDGNTLVIGTTNYDLPFAANGNARVFDYDAASGRWVAAGIFYGDAPSTGSNQDGFGGAIAVDDDAQRIAVVAETDTPVTGAVYLIRRGAGGWEREARVEALSGGRPSHVSSAALALSDDRMLLPWGNGVLVFRNDGTGWVEDHLIPAPPEARYFGRTVRFDDSTAVVGAYLIDPQIGAVFVHELGPPVSRYCPSTINSTGQAARIDASGTMSITANDTTLSVTHCPVGTFGLFFYGQQVANLPLGDGRLCVSPFAPGLFRILPTVQADQDGSATMALDFLALPTAGQIQGGDTWSFQCWFRDSIPGGTGSNLSDAIQVTFCP